MKWNELKKEWKETPKDTRMYLVVATAGIIGSLILIFMGLVLALNSAKDGEPITEYGAGLLLAMFGFWMYNVMWISNTNRRIDRLKEGRE